MEPDWVVRFYNQRGTAEQRIKEGKYTFRWTRLSCRRFRDNEVRLQLHALAYNLASFLRCIELPEAMADWSLTSLQLKLIHCLPGDACITEKEDRRPRRAPCPCHHLPAGRGRGYRPDGARHTCCHPPSSGTSVMRVTEIQAEPEQKRQDRSARHAEIQVPRARTPRQRGPINPHSVALTIAAGLGSTKHLIRRQKQANSASSGMPLGGCRIRRSSRQMAGHLGNVG